MTDLPDKIGQYVVSRLLGSGGMGRVLVAHTLGGEPVAIKQIRPDRLNEQMRARFEQEAIKAQRVIGTSRVARFLEADPYAEQPWIAMQLVQGPTLREFVDTVGVIPSVLVASIGALLSEGLAAIHKGGLRHRDLKPANIILGDDGPVIIDFGLATFVDATSTLSTEGQPIGTLVAMPPEQAAGQLQVTPTADVYGLGVVLLYAVAKHYPYWSLDQEELLEQLTNPDVAPDLSGVPSALEPLIMGMLAQDPAERPSVDQVAAQCAELVVANNMTTRQARRALLAHLSRNWTIEDSGAGNDPFILSPSLEARLDAEAAEVAAQQAPGVELPDGPLAGSPGLYAQALQDLAESPVPELPEAVPNPPAHEAAEGKRRKRAPASKRIANELRDAYAHSPVL